MISAVDQRIELSPSMRAWLERGGDFPSTISIKLPTGAMMDFVILDRSTDGSVPGVASRVGHKGFTLRVRSTSNNRIYAAKISLREDYSEEKLREEMVLASEIDDLAPIVRHEYVGLLEPLPGQPEPNVTWLCFVGRWIEGRTLEQFLLDNPKALQPDFALLILRNLLSAVIYLERKNLKHDDLHLGNVMISRMPQEIVDSNPGAEPFKVEVIDIGSLKRADTKTEKNSDDWSSYAACIVKVHNALHRNREVASRYPPVLRKLFEFAQQLSDDDQSRQFIDAISLMAPLTEARRLLSGATSSSDQNSLTSPFSAISAEHLASDQMLLRLFENNLEWFSDIGDTTPAVLTGPRGCGKSMVFRYLALRTHLVTAEKAAKALKDLNFVGIYIGCASDLQNDLLWIKREAGRAASLAPAIVTFFNLVIARELFRTLAACAQHATAGPALGVTTQSVRELVAFAQENLGLPNAQIAAAGLDPGQTISDELDRQRIRLARAMLEGRPPQVELPETFVRDLTRAAVRLMPGLAKKPIVFLLDDYTQQRLGEDVQSVLNPILWNRDAACVFKVSCEPFGFSDAHIDGAKLDQNREFIVVNTGRKMLDGSSGEVAQRRKFVEGLINKRLEAAGYAGRVESLIGPSEFKHDTALAAAIRDTGRGNAFHYHGLEVLANAWSGDVATVLFMVREMFQRGSVTKESDKRISKHHQHEAIVYVSKALVERIEYCHPFGNEMKGVLDTFARLARRLLMEGPYQRDDEEDDNNKVPQRRYRIEIDIAEEGTILQQLARVASNSTTPQLFRELIRRSIFIDLGEGRSKDQKRTLRIQVRSSLLPHYGTSLVRKNYMAVRTLQELAMLLERQPTFTDRVWARSGESPMKPPGGLFESRT